MLLFFGMLEVPLLLNNAMAQVYGHSPLQCGSRIFKEVTKQTYTQSALQARINSYPAMRLLARYCYIALCTRARYRVTALCTLASICNNSHCSCPLHRAECFYSAIESTIACIRLSALDYASL